MDVSSLYAAAARVDDLAEQLGARAARIAAAAATTRWYSPAARTYFAEIDDTMQRLVGCAANAYDLADRIRVHAATILATP